MSEPLRDKLVKESRRVEEDTLHSSKGHYAAAERWRNVHFRIGVPTAIATGVAGLILVGGPAKVYGVPLDVVFGLVSIAGAVATALMTFLTPDRRTSAHQVAADRYNALKGRARRFHEIDVHRSFSDDELSDRLDALIRERDGLNESSPLIPASAYKKAIQGIDEGQAKYRIDEEQER